jgi:hypothetical protein
MDDSEMDKKDLEHDTTANYEVGYAKPPKGTQFKRGVSGNPKGRPKAAPDFKAGLLREARTLITITENGRRIRVPKHDVITKQFVNNAMKGKTSDLRLYRDTYQEACAEAALLAAQRARDAAIEKSKNYKKMTTEELEAMLAGQLAAAARSQKGDDTMTTE